MMVIFRRRARCASCWQRASFEFERRRDVEQESARPSQKYEWVE